MRQLIKSKKNAPNLVKSVNTWAVSLPSYSVVFIDVTKTELAKLDTRTTKEFNTT